MCRFRIETRSVINLDRDREGRRGKRRLVALIANRSPSLSDLFCSFLLFGDVYGD